MENTILLIDGSSFIFRAFYAIKNLTAPNGMPTNAIYGIINMLKQMQKKYTTPHWVCVFDAKGKTFRDEMYPAYKANRRETPPELVLQFPYIHELIADLGIPVIIQEGVEADDVIATIAQKYAAQGYHILVATGDKDFAQIVNANITLINTMTNEVLDISGVEDKFGVKPEQIIDYLSLIGDSVDNVPGVTKCGPKTAQKWLTEFGSIQNLILNQAKLAGVVGENFRAAIDWLPTAQKLITIDCNVSISSTDISQLANLKLKAVNWPKLVSVFRELNFRTWLREAEAQLSALPIAMTSMPQTTRQSTAKKLCHIDNPDTLQSIIANILASKETSAFNLILDDYTNIKSAICQLIIITQDTVFQVQLGNDKTPELLFNQSAQPAEFLNILADYLQSSAPKICYNYKQQLYILASHDIHLSGICGDLQLASYIQNSLQSHNLNAILERYAPHNSVPAVEELLGKGAKRLCFSSLDTDIQNKFVLSNSQNLLEAHQNILNKLSPAELKLYLETELPLAKLLFDLEREGVLIDIPDLKHLAIGMHAKLQQIENKVHQETGIVFNLNSPKQLQDILFNQLKLPTSGIKKNTSGYSTDEESLKILAEAGYPLVERLLEYRFLNKLLNTYINRLPEYADENHLLHTSLEQTIVTSGRLSSKDPNLQNIPVRSEYGQAIRACFIAKPGHKLVCADYSQIELRILAQITQDQNLIAAFKSNADIHLATASQIFHKPLAEVSKDERSYAKSINFGLIYGKSVFGLAKELKIDRAAAKLYIDNYFAQYPQVKEYMENIKKIAHQNGYVETYYGRKIFLANINTSNNIIRQAEERLALNAPMQGTGADIIKIAMLNVNRWLSENHLHSKMVLQVHDELIFQVPDAEVEVMLANLPRLMTEATQLAVPLKVDIKAATNWAAAH